MARHILNFFESLSSLTYNRLNKTIWSFVPFRLFLSILQTFTQSRSKLELGAISFQLNWCFYRMVQYIENFFESLSSLTYHRLNKAIWSFIPFRLFFVYPEMFTPLAARSWNRAPFIFSKIGISTEWLGTFKIFLKVYLL